MKKLFWAILLVTPFFLTAQGDTPSYTMFQTIMLEVDKTKTAEFGQGMKEHNEKYHNKAPYSVGVFNIATGPNSNKLVWMMGPCKHGDMDNFPNEEEHGQHWREQVLKYTKNDGPVEFWKRDDDLSKPATEQFPIFRIRMMTVREGQGYRVNGILKKLHEAVVSLGIKNSHEVYRNEFLQGTENGRHMSVVTGMNKWAELDEDVGFVKAFEKLHGAGSFQIWNRERLDVFSNTWDEYWELVPFLSSPSN